jgi:hypothetical protein
MLNIRCTALTLALINRSRQFFYRFKEKDSASSKMLDSRETRQQQCESEEEGECEEATTHHLTEATTSATEWMGVTTNSDDCSYRWGTWWSRYWGWEWVITIFHENPAWPLQLGARGVWSAERDESQLQRIRGTSLLLGIRVTTFDITQLYLYLVRSWSVRRYHGAHYDSCTPLAALFIQFVSRLSYLVSCTIWTRRDIKKAELSVLDISSAIIARVESMPESMNYFYSGLILSVALCLVPSIKRLSDQIGSDSVSNVSVSLLPSDMIQVNLDTYTDVLCRIISVAFGNNLW